MFSVFQIVQVSLMMIGLLFKTDMEISLLPISVLAKQDQPFYAVPQEERDIQQLFLLSSMNQLVVHLHWRQWAHRKNEAKQADGIIASAQRQFLHHVYPFHQRLTNRCCKDTTKRAKIQSFSLEVSQKVRIFASVNNQ